MAAKLRKALVFAYANLITFFLIVTTFLPKQSFSLQPCTTADFKKIVVPCDQTTRKKKIMYYMSTECDLKSNESVQYPKPIFDLPCECEAGKGQVDTKDGINCVPCKAGQFSYGGELLADFRNWNGSSGVPGNDFDAYSYCSNFLTGTYCKSWRPGGEGEYLVSGDFKNATELLCFEQSILVVSRIFVGGPGENSVSFLYKVDGKECKRGQLATCSNGLFFYVNSVRKMLSESQFQWKLFEMEVPQGPVQLKFVYQRSCTRSNILDVAYLKHISFIGTSSPVTMCTNCSVGTHSKSDGSSMCTKCNQNTYQDLPGQTTCKPCQRDYFSRFAADRCIKLPKCTVNDFYTISESIDKCTKSANGSWIQNQVVKLPAWPAVFPKSCVEVANTDDPKYKRPVASQTMCKCQPGYYLNVTGPKPSCKMCRRGSYSDGSFTECKQCPVGHAALPGFYMEHFSNEGLPSVFQQTCSGSFCKNDSQAFWQPRGSYIATRRLPGNFDVKFEVKSVYVNYFKAVLKFNCSLDCRLTPDGSRLAKHNHCFMRIVIMKDGGPFKEEDCVNQFKSYLRNGTVITHSYSLPEPGYYNFSALFHHEDEGNYSLVSYEARFYFIDLIGIKRGVAKNCVKCPEGTRLSLDKSICEKCPNGTYSNSGSTQCQQCAEGFFASKEGSSKCIPCGKGTRSNERRDDCVYNGCRFKPEPGLEFDLSPLRVDGGPMHKVRNQAPNPKFQFFPLEYYVNICSKNHDNTSCTKNVRKVDREERSFKVVSQIFLKTMACKHWSFDKQNSYSIGEVLSFHAFEGKKKRDGLTVRLSGGYNCWHKGLKRLVEPVTIIDMVCDLEAGVNQPEAKSNETAIDEKHCHYQLLWRTTFACPLCTDNDYSEVYSKCVNGTQYKTRTRKNTCRNIGGSNDKTMIPVPCSTKKQTALIVTVVCAVLLIIVLAVFLIIFIRNNRNLRANLFSTHKTFSKVLEDDEDELVDHIQM